MTEADEALKLDFMLCFAIYAAGHAFTRFYKPRLDALGLTYPQYLVFMVLWEQDGLTVKGLGEKLFLDSGTITPLIKRLETRGLVRRQRDADDERLVRILLTDAGRALKDKAMAVPLQVVGAVGLDGDGAAQLRLGLHRLRERLDTMTGV